MLDFPTPLPLNTHSKNQTCIWVTIESELCSKIVEANLRVILGFEQFQCSVWPESHRQYHNCWHGLSFASLS